MSDQITLTITASLLKGTALVWWVSVESSIKNWIDFEWKFLEFFVSEETCKAWWTELETMQQGDRTVSQLQLNLEELFIRLDIKDKITKKWRFIKALKPELAYKVEKVRPATYINAVSEAKRIETLRNKYHKTDYNMTPLYLISGPSSSSARSLGRSPNIDDSIVDSLVENFQNMLKIHLVQP
ncbi:hypothetical protein EC973_006139 [Apophysomyces ossiformis]|uniref:Retrotransposon gag domain-containing protein n=1 Tax=Apophysomyces ossiformis TaxID=679940 RepID=A0A8H7BEI1_9FUNG|nr:hypothetical protein EC973_006139 [Apophysomyces ossiformis]